MRNQQVMPGLSVVRLGIFSGGVAVGQSGFRLLLDFACADIGKLLRLDQVDRGRCLDYEIGIVGLCVPVPHYFELALRRAQPLFNGFVLFQKGCEVLFRLAVELVALVASLFEARKDLAGDCGCRRDGFLVVVELVLGFLREVVRLNLREGTDLRLDK